MARCLLGLGSNLGDRRATLASACAHLQAIPATQLLARSEWFVTKPIGGTTIQSEFLNGAALLETSLPPQQLAQILQTIENHLGRERVVRWDSRTIDIDLLLYDQQVIETPTLVVPHPRMAFRTFVLEPAVEIAGAMLHPPSGWTLSRLLSHLRTSPRVVALASSQREQADRVAQDIASRLGVRIWQNSRDETSCGGILQRFSGIELPEAGSTAPPLVLRLTVEELLNLRGDLLLAGDQGKPALVILIESETEQISEQLLTGLGPIAKITSADPETILQEAAAAICSVWPDLLETEAN